MSYETLEEIDISCRLNILKYAIFDGTNILRLPQIYEINISIQYIETVRLILLVLSFPFYIYMTYSPKTIWTI